MASRNLTTDACGREKRRATTSPPCRRLWQALAFAFFTPSAALANSHNADTSGAFVDEVVVTAARRPVNAAQVSLSVAVIDAETARSGQLVTDALATTPGVSLQQTTPGQGAAIIRGLKGSSVLHLVDGMRLNNAIFRSAPTQYLALVPRIAVEHIEVLGGTPASLYGSDAVAGVVQIISRVPAIDAATTAVRGEAQLAFGTAAQEQSFGASVDIGNRQVVSSLGLEYLKTGDRRIGGGARIGPSGYDARGGRYAMAVTPDADRSWLFDVQFLEQPSTPRVDELTPGFGQTEAASSEFRFAPNRRLFAHARYSRRDGPLGLDWRTSIAWQRIDDDRITRALNADVQRLEQNRSDLAGALATVSQDSERFSWIAGIEFYNDKVTSQRHELDLSGGLQQSVPSRFPDGSRVRQAALFANGERPVSGNQTLIAGIRASSVRVTLPDTAATTAATLTTSDLSGDVGWIYRLHGGWQLVANAGFGFRAPNVFDLGTLGERPGNRFNIPNANLESESVLQGDIGLRHYAEHWRFALMVYALSYDDRITTVLTGAVTADGRDVTRSVNAASSSIRGIELATRWHVGSSVTAFGYLNYTRGKEQTNGVEEPADRIPPLHGRAGIEIALDKTLRVATSLGFAAQQDRLSSRDLRDPRIDPVGTPGWVSWAAHAHWQLQRGWRLSLGVDNILDKRYRMHGSGIDAPGRNLSVRIRSAWE